MHVPHADRCRRIARTPERWSDMRGEEGALRGIHANHGTSHSNPASPKITKNERHPKRPTKFPPSSIPTAGPRARPAIITELANPRLPSWKCPPRILPYAGKATDSPTPRTTRMASSATNPCRAPVTAVAADHIKSPSAKTHFTSKRSTSQPAGICSNAYV